MAIFAGNPLRFSTRGSRVAMEGIGSITPDSRQDAPWTMDSVEKKRQALVTKDNFLPITLHDGYLPIKDHGLIGDGSTSALVGRDGAISWMCVPRFDSQPLFCRILDRNRGGAFTVAPENLRESRQYYDGDTAVLVTEMRSDTGLVQVTDALTLRAGANLGEGMMVGRSELLRSVRVLEGQVRLTVEVNPRGDAQSERRSDGLRVRAFLHPDLDLQLFATQPLDGLRTTLELSAGDRFDVTLQWAGHPHRFHPFSFDDILSETKGAWTRWLSCFHYDGPRKDLVKRSAITLKVLDHIENGAIVAAPTSSLPETIGGERNWDYRYAWVRDVAFSVFALRRIGLDTEAWAFLGWVLDAVERDGHANVMYTLDGVQPGEEWEDHNLEGYRKSPPVRWGNGAADQHQHDVFGEILDCAYQWVTRGGDLDERLWDRLREITEGAKSEWRRPDHGIWEVRTPGRLFTYSAAMCHVALDRAATLAERLGFEGDIKGWRSEAERIQKAIIDEAWDEDRQTFTEHIGEGGGLDASLLTLPMRRVIDAKHPRMVATTKAVAERLGAGDGLIYRYLPDESPDGLEGHEGAFLLCSFWLVDNLALQGRLDEAMDLYNSLCDRAGPLGLLPEQIDPPSGDFLGNYPQAFSHVGVIASGVTLDREIRGT
jgi:alpha,alpha-trehalase